MEQETKYNKLKINLMKKIITHIAALVTVSFTSFAQVYIGTSTTITDYSATFLQSIVMPMAARSAAVRLPLVFMELFRPTTALLWIYLFGHIKAFSFFN